MVYLSNKVRTHIVTLKDDGKTWAQIIGIMATRYRIPVTRRGCQKLYKKYKETGDVADKPKSGRPPKVNSRVSRLIRRACLKDRKLTANQLASQCKIQGQSLSRQTVSRILLKYGLKWCVAKRKPLLNICQRQARLQWAKRLCHWGYHRWKKVMFTDESIFKLYNDSMACKIRRTSIEAFHKDCLSSTVKHGPQVHVWGIMGPFGPGPMKMVKGNLNSQKYQEEILSYPPIKDVCESMLFPYSGAIFQQDKAPAHWSLSTRHYLSNRNMALLPWPGNSPDMSPIENIWAIIGQRVKKLQLTNAKQLYQAVQDVWYNLPISLFHNLYQSMPRRLAAVIVAKGGTTNY